MFIRYIHDQQITIKKIKRNDNFNQLKNCVMYTGEQKNVQILSLDEFEFYKTSSLVNK